MREIKNKKSPIKFTIIFLSTIATVLFVIFAYFAFFYDGNYNIINSEDVNDYVSVAEETVTFIPNDDSPCGLSSDYSSSVKLKRISFKNLPQKVTENFNLENTRFVGDLSDGDIVSTDSELSNSLIYEIHDNILSIYTEEYDTLLCTYFNEYNFYSLNIDLNNNKLMTNKKMLDKFEIDINDLYTILLNDLIERSQSLTGGSFPDDYYDESSKYLPANIYNLTQDTTVLEENFDDHIEYLSNKYDAFVLYIKNDKLYVTYDLVEILSLLDWKTLNVITEPYTIILN